MPTSGPIQGIVLALRGAATPDEAEAYLKGLEKGVSDGIAALRQSHADLLAALTKLSNEVLGSLPLVEPMLRQEIGNTNYQILMQRAEEARAAIKKAEGL